MKRTIAIILLISLVSACISSGGGEGGEKPGQQGGSIKTTTTLQTSSGGGIVDKIIDITTAIASGQSYKCTYTYEGVQSESWIKGERYYSKTTSGGV